MVLIKKEKKWGEYLKGDRRFHLSFSLFFLAQKCEKPSPNIPIKFSKFNPLQA